jgi:hypothetical protein
VRKFFGWFLLFLCAAYTFGLARAAIANFALDLPVPTTIFVTYIVAGIITGYFGVRLVRSKPVLPIIGRGQ